MNPWSIIVPCHRVVGTSGALTGFAGGLGRKRWLLEHEGVRVERGNGEADPKARIIARGAQVALFADA
jgi:methylated-DNA-[protein]-cysteine S-methyltransferase